jgi:hypothetical protein
MLTPESVGARHAEPVLDGAARSVFDLVGAKPRPDPRRNAAPHPAKTRILASLSSRPINLSSRAQRGICFFLLASTFLPLAAHAQTSPQRPHILGIAGVTIYVSDAHSARKFYDSALDQPATSSKRPCFWCEKPPSFSLDIPLNRFQFFAFELSQSHLPSNLIKEVTFLTDDVAALRNYLLANLTDANKLTGPGMKYLSLSDPEGHKISFAETDGVLKDPKNIAIMTKGGYENEIIHAGFIVHDRAATEHFYKDVLGFRPYWHGGMKDDQRIGFRCRFLMAPTGSNSWSTSRQRPTTASAAS